MNILGEYNRNAFVIRFPSDSNIFIRDSKFVEEPESKEDYSLFIHEYWHYLLNISTYTHFIDFYLWQKISLLFSRTLKEDLDGDSNGRLSDEDVMLLEQIYEYFDEKEKQTTINCDDFKIIGDPIEEEVSIKLDRATIPYTRLTFPVEYLINQEYKEGKLTLTLTDIEESIANSIESMVDEDQSNPPMPYLVLKKISDYFKCDLSNYEIAAIGTLSLLTSSPGYSFMNLIKSFKILQERNDRTKSLEYLAKQIKERTVSQWFEQFLGAVDELKQTFTNKEPIQTAISYYLDRYIDAFKLRKENPLFDLEIFKNGIFDKGAFNLFSFRFPHCNIIQEKEGNADTPRRDLLIAKDFCLNVNNFEVPIGHLTKILHCQLHYVKAHWAGDRFIRSEIITNSKCPYYTSCSLSTRENRGEVCKTKPWDLYFGSNNQACEYSLAVASLVLESVKINNVFERDI